MKNSFKKIIASLLCFVIVFSAFGAYVSVGTAATTGNYYVQYGGTGDGRTVGNPARSVKTAIASLNADGLTAGDTANIYVLSSSGVSSGSHTLTPWGIAGDPEQTHTADIVIQGYEGRQWLAYGSGMNSNINLCGPTTFTNLSLFTTRTDHGYIRAYGNNVTFGAGMKHYKLSGSSTQECYSPVVVMTRNTNSDSAYDVTATQTFTYNSPALAEGMLYIGSENFDNRRHKQDANIILNHSDIGSSGSYKLIFAGTHSNNSTHIFEKNLNIDVRSAAKVGFQGNVKTSALDKSSSKQKIQVNGGLQIITNPSTIYYNIGVADGISPYAAITGVNNIVNTSFWVLTVPSADRSKIDFTATAGTYSVSPLYVATATNNSTGATVTSSNNQLTVPAGDWTITFARQAGTVNYYVQYGGTGDGSSPATPAGSVAQAIAAANAAGLDSSDTANVYIMSSTYDSAGQAHTLTPWRIGSEEYPSYTAKLVVQGYEGKQWLAHASGTVNSLSINGPTTFRNLNIYCTGSYFDVYAKGNNVTYDNCSFYKYDGTKKECFAPHLVMNRYTSDGNITNSQTIEYKSGARAEGQLWIPSDSYSQHGYTQDVNIVFDHEDIGYVNPLSVKFGGAHSTSKTSTFQRNLNFDIRNAAKVSFVNGGSAQKVKVNGGLQVITKPGVTFNSGGAYAALTGCSTLIDTSVWVLTVSSSDRDKIDFTSTAGTYNIAEGYVARAVDSSSNVYTSTSGVLTVPAGDYSVSFLEDSEDQYSDYIFNRGSGLQNTYSKLTTGDKTLNVLYYGGSVTEGYGTTDHTRRWRNLTTTWLTTNFPEATINPINKACGESGTFLGSYRMNRDILPQNPDLVFLEYSINDAYDNATYERASYQFETIVRQIKENFPTCDIITVLVTDYGRAGDARLGTLHTQAQAHEDISIAYNLPSLHVGCALASLLPESFTLDQWKSICGALDTVHLKEAGNEVYFAVIEEYLENELLSLKYNGTTANYTLPELQNNQLLDGNITYIAPSAALVARSEELGGYKISYMHDSNFTVKGYEDLFKFKYSEEYEDAMLCIEFNGTELIGLLHNYNDGRNSSNTRAYSISIDGSDFTEHYCYHMNPTTFATGLAPGDHVAKIKFAVEDSDNWLWVGAFFSRDEYRRTVKGSEYTPEFVNANFGVECADIKDGDSLGLRFVFDINKSFLSELPTVVEYGAITLPTDDTQGKEIFLDTAVVKEWQWDNETKSNFTAKTTGSTPTKVVANNILEESTSNIKYSLCLTSVDSAKYDKFYTVRGYIKYQNASGATKVVYTDDFESSLYKVCAELPEDDRTETEESVISYVEGDRVANYFATNTIKAYNSGYAGNEDTNPNHKIYTLENNLVVRDVTVSGLAGTEKTEIAFLSDPHFNYINEKDILEGNTNALASYRGREWLRDGSQMSNFNKAMEFASMFKKTVMGGDAVDYLSNGALEMTKRLLTNKSINGSIKMIMGNHEYMETCQADTAGLTNKYSLEQRYAITQSYWANDVYFDYEILKKEDGVTDNVMLIYMDNAANKYWASQIPKLEAALSEARTKNVPVLIFQHSPVLTMNSNETSVYLWEGYANIGGNYVLGNKQFATASKKTGTVNMTSYTGYPGSANSDANTLAVYTMIRKNYDIIKGVFHGHEHSNMYTEIIGLNSDGSVATDGSGNPYVIPQHGAFGVHYNSVMKITIE